MGDITELLHAARPGDGKALDAVFDKVYSSLRAMAAQRLVWQPGENTLSATELVHEAYLKLTGASRLDLIDRHHFHACAGRAMRQILVDRARARGAAKRGSGMVACALDEVGEVVASEPELLDIDAALDRLDAISPGLRELVEMRVFAGLTLAQLAETSGRSSRSISRDWQRARALLLAQLDTQA
ncbi:MAG: ECF-type sigma factor [Lysobacteraceae bacterium]